MVVTKHGLDFLKGLPGNIGRELVIDTDFPFLHGKAFNDRLTTSCRPRLVCISPVNEGSRVCRILEDRNNGANGRRFPGQLARTVADWEQELLLIEILKNLDRCATLEKGVKNQSDTILNFA